MITYYVSFTVLTTDLVTQSLLKRCAFGIRSISMLDSHSTIHHSTIYTSVQVRQMNKLSCLILESLFCRLNWQIIQDDEQFQAEVVVIYPYIPKLNLLSKCSISQNGSYKPSQILFIIKPRTSNKLEHILQCLLKFKYMSIFFISAFLDPHLTAHHSSIGVQLTQVTELRTHTTWDAIEFYFIHWKNVNGCVNCMTFNLLRGKHVGECWSVFELSWVE